MDAEFLTVRVTDEIAVITFGTENASSSTKRRATLSCDLRIAEDGDYQIGFPEPNFGLVHPLSQKAHHGQPGA